MCQFHHSWQPHQSPDSPLRASRHKVQEPYLVLPPFQIISRTKNLRESKHLKFDQNQRFITSKRYTIKI
jgi:hypothetical protein